MRIKFYFDNRIRRFECHFFFDVNIDLDIVSCIDFLSRYKAVYRRSLRYNPDICSHHNMKHSKTLVSLFPFESDILLQLRNLNLIKDKICRVISMHHYIRLYTMHRRKLFEKPSVRPVAQASPVLFFTHKHSFLQC